jgi:hypothetical protein
MGCIHGSTCRGWITRSITSACRRRGAHCSGSSPGPARWDGAHRFDECGDQIDEIVCLKTDGPDPGVETKGYHGCELATFVEMDPSYAGLCGTKMLYEDAIVELARDWLARTEAAG